MIKDFFIDFYIKYISYFELVFHVNFSHVVRYTNLGRSYRFFYISLFIINSGSSDCHYQILHVQLIGAKRQENYRKHFSCLLHLLKCILCIWEDVSVFVSLCLCFARLSLRVFIGNPHLHNNNHLSALQQVFMTCWWLCPHSCSHMSFSQRTTPS